MPTRTRLIVEDRVHPSHPPFVEVFSFVGGIRSLRHLVPSRLPCRGFNICLLTRRRGANTAHTQTKWDGLHTRHLLTSTYSSRVHTHTNTHKHTKAQRGPTKYGAGSRRGALYHSWAHVRCLHPASFIGTRGATIKRGWCSCPLGSCCSWRSWERRSGRALVWLAAQRASPSRHARPRPRAPSPL